MAKRIAVVHNEKLKDYNKKLYVQSLCPINRAGTECISIGEEKKLFIDEATCIGCGICVKAAPEAIKIINLPEALSQEPIHRYGENEFALYDLPTPMFGKVVGILGINGIGKSTAIGILAGIVKPNFGRLHNKKISNKELLERFKGTEAQLFFEDLLAGKIKVSYKPQHVDMIPKQIKGTVLEVLERVDEKGELASVVEKLGLKDVLDHDIKIVSGGELQRIAIAACVLRKANLYIFDEPTSYLDIKQRLRVAKFIKEMVNDETAVLVVEHDLIILDYMTDLVHLMYGKEGVFGVVSQPKTTKAGINIYLNGYLKDENVRFRDHTIKFQEKPPRKVKREMKLTSWQNVEKKLGSFSLAAKEGELFKGETIGVLGENGIGKTSFVKILAGVLKEDAGEIIENVAVSYKPQYLEASDDLVMSILHDAMTKYEIQLARPLDLQPLLLKKINELSGGELQRVAIALCLSKDAKLYLLDEPSAFLDVEQRLIVSRTIRNFMEEKNATGLIVDHDLLFVDYLSEKLIVFDGKPAVHGEVKGPFEMEDGMNMFLKDVGITFRRDEESKRPRANKSGSQLDRQQKDKGKFYYG